MLPKETEKSVQMMAGTFLEILRLPIALVTATYRVCSRMY